MKTLVVYATTHGCTRKYATKLSECLHGEVTVANLKKDKVPDPAGFDAVVVGGSIHAGRVQGAVRSFCQRHAAVLMTKTLGLFLSCMEEGEKAQAQFKAAFPAELQEKAAAKGVFGGEFDLEKMGWLSKAIVRKVAKVDKSVSRFDESALIDFAQKMNPL